MLLPTILCTDWMLIITLWERYDSHFTNKEMEAGRDELGAMVLTAAKLSWRSTPWFWNGMDWGLVRSSPVPPPNRGLIMFERSLSHSYMLDMSMRLTCFSYPSWLATSRNSSVMRIKPRSKLNSAGNFRIQYLKGIKYVWQLEDLKLDLCVNYSIILQITFNREFRTTPQLAISYPPAPSHWVSPFPFNQGPKSSPTLSPSFWLSPEGNPSRLMASRWECAWWGSRKKEFTLRAVFIP